MQNSTIFFKYSDEIYLELINTKKNFKDNFKLYLMQKELSLLMLVYLSLALITSINKHSYAGFSRQIKKGLQCITNHWKFLSTKLIVSKKKTDVKLGIRALKS